MNYHKITLPAPQEIQETADGQFFFEIYLSLKTGGRYYSTNAAPLNPRSLFASIAPVNPTIDGAMCIVRSVEWLNETFYLTFEIVDRMHWLNTGALKAWEGPIDICYAFHGRLKKD